MIHYKSKEWYIGDVHPFYHNDRLYLFYLKPNGITRCDACFDDPEKVVCNSTVLAVTDDYINFEEHLINGIIVNIVEVDGIFYTRYNDKAHAFESTDLVRWKQSEKYPISLDNHLFPAGARDYALFYDADAGGMRVTTNAYFTNEHNGCGTGLECAVGISGVIPREGDGNVEQRVLYPLENRGRNIMLSAEPECNQMLKIGKRWYLFTSLARQTTHWVGPLSYWIGNENTPIDSEEYTHKREYRLDGEDLCAAQVAPYGDKFFKFGWIPMSYHNQEWGGHLNLPHEVYQLANGKLACRLAPEFAKSIISEEVSQTIVLNPSTFFGPVAYANERMQQYGVEARLDLSAADRAGFVLDDRNGIHVELCRESGLMSVKRKLPGAADYVFASLEIEPGEWCGDAILHAIYDDDIVEVFLNEKYALCARTDNNNKNVKVGVFGNGTVKEFSTYKLRKPTGYTLSMDLM